MRFHNFLAILRTSLTFACLLVTGDCCCSKLLIASTFTRGNEIFMVCELLVKPSASIVVS